MADDPVLREKILQMVGVWARWALTHLARRSPATALSGAPGARVFARAAMGAAVFVPGDVSYVVGIGV